PDSVGRATKNTDGTITTTGGTQLDNVASAGDITDEANALHAVNAGDLNNAVTGATDDIVSKGLDFVGDNDTTTVHRDLGETLAINGGSTSDATATHNIITKGNKDGSIQIDLAKNIDLGEGGSVELAGTDGSGNANGTTTTLDGNGTTTTDKDGNNTTTGADGVHVADASGDNTSDLGSDGLTVADDQGNEAHYGADGIDGVGDI